MDFMARTAILSMNMLSGVGTPDNENLNIYRRATVRIAGLLLFFVEPPHPKYNFLLDGEPLSVSGDSVRAGQNSEMDCLLPALPQNSTVYRFFLDEWNSFVYLAAEGVEFLWDDQGSG
jgi:hypothetical protein